MRKALVFALAVLACASSSVVAAKVPKGSFLRTPVGSTEQLAQQVTDDAIVAARYAKHFRMSRNAVVDYFKDNLRIGRLRKDCDTTVYVIVDRTGIEATRRVLAAGTYVFVGSDGQPLLEARTGNPLADRLPGATTPRQPIAAAAPGPKSIGEVVSSAGTAASDGVVTKVLGSGPAEIGAAVPVPVGAGSDVTPLVIPSAAEVEAVVEIVASMPVGGVPAAVGAASGLGSVLPVAAVLGGLALAGSGGGSGSGGAVENPVPEPASLAALAVAASGFLLARRRRR